MDRALYIAQQRQQEGVGSVLDSKRAELDSARVDLRIAELETNLDVLRERLGRTIGRSPATLETVSASIPCCARPVCRRTILPRLRSPTPPAFASPMSTSAPPTIAPAPSTR